MPQLFICHIIYSFRLILYALLLFVVGLSVHQNFVLGKSFYSANRSAIIADSLDAEDSAQADSTSTNSENQKTSAENETNQSGETKQDTTILFRYNQENGCEKNYKQTSLPSSRKTLSPFDTSGINGHHIKAIANHYRVTYNKGEGNEIYSITMNGEKRKSSAMLETMPYIKAVSECRKVKDFKSAEEFSNYSDSLSLQFQQKITVQLDLLSPSIQAATLDTADLVDVRLIAFDQEIKPQKIVRLGLKSKLNGFDSWYERRVKLVFPRTRGMNNLLDDRQLSLLLRLNTNENNQVDFQKEYRFELLQLGKNRQAAMVESKGNQ